MINNCFGNFNGRCQILKESKCIGNDSCSFFKTKEECEDSFEKVYERLNSLDMKTQEAISEQYYNGKFPWRKGGVSYDS